jgi:hypothetical protein
MYFQSNLIASDFFIKVLIHTVDVVITVEKVCAPNAGRRLRAPNLNKPYTVFGGQFKQLKEALIVMSVEYMLR